MKQCVEPGDASEGASMSTPGVKSSSSRDFLEFSLFVRGLAWVREDTNKDTIQLSMTFRKLDFSDKKNVLRRGHLD